MWSAYSRALLLVWLTGGVVGHEHPHVLNVESRLGQSGSTATANAERAAPTTSALPVGATALDINFSDYFSSSGSVESFLLDRGLKITTRLIGGTPFTHTLTPDNVDIVDGALQLTVSAGAVDDVKSAQLQTVVDDLLYLNIHHDPCQGGQVGGRLLGFLHLSIRYPRDRLRDPHLCALLTITELLPPPPLSSLPNATAYIAEPSVDGTVLPGLHLTDQATSAGKALTTKAVQYTFDPREGFHDYTLEWTKEATKFWVDGELWATLTTNVPSEPTSFMWNNWSAGSAWTAGPPTGDNVLEIESISGWYTRA